MLVQTETFTRRLARSIFSCYRVMRGSYRNLPFTMYLVAVWTRKIGADGADARIEPLQNDGVSVPFTGSELVVEGVVGDQARRAIGVNSEMIGARGAVGIVKREGEPCRVTRRQESWQRQVSDDGVSNDQLLLNVTDGVAAVGDRHQPKLSLEIRDVQRDLRRSVALDLHRTGKKRHGARAGHLQWLSPDRFIATLVNCAGIGTAVEQATVIVADIEPEPPLAEQEFYRIRRLISRELQDPFVDRGKRYVGLLPGFHAVDIHREIDQLPGCDLVRRRDCNREGLLRHIDPHPGEPHGAHRIVRTTGGKRSIERNDCVSATAPVGGRLHLDRGAIFCDVNQTGFENTIARNCQLRLARKRAFDTQSRRLANLEGGLL